MAEPVIRVITKSVDETRREAFNAWQAEIVPITQAVLSPGAASIKHLPADRESGRTVDLVVVAFASQAAHDTFRASPEYQAWLERGESTGLFQLQLRESVKIDDGSLGGFMPPDASSAKPGERHRN